MRQLIITTVAALLGCTMLWRATDGFRAITAEGARRVQISANPEPVPSVVLETMDGSWQSLNNPDSPVLLEFIYTTCPTICQTSGGDFAELRDFLLQYNLQVPMFSVSFDPETDTLENMQDYAKWHTATGMPWTVGRPLPQDLEPLLDLFRITVIPDGWGGYQHNVAVLLINRDGAFSGAFDTRDYNAIRAALEEEL